MYYIHFSNKVNFLKYTHKTKQWQQQQQKHLRKKHVAIISSATAFVSKVCQNDFETDNMVLWLNSAMSKLSHFGQAT